MINTGKNEDDEIECENRQTGKKIDRKDLEDDISEFL